MWELVLPPAPKGEGRKAVHVVRAVISEIERGRLRVGEPLPSTRMLAKALSVNRKVVTAAYADLARQGWITITRAKGASVCAEVWRARGATAQPRAAGFPLCGPHASALPHVGRPPGALLLLGGVPELRFAQQLHVGRAYRRVLATKEGQRLLDYGDSAGDIHLRHAIAAMLRRTRGLAHHADDLLVTRGSQQAFYLIARALLPAGATIAVEALGYPMAWAAFRAAGAALAPIAVDREGMDIDALERACAQGEVSAVYVSPHHHVPTTATMSATRRLRLLALARAKRLMVIEDDHDHEFQYDGAPVLPLAAADEHAHVIYVGSLAKVVAPGLRIGYVAATVDVISRLTQYRERIDQQGDLVLERAVAHLFEDGSIERHIRRARREYRDRRDALCAALSAHLPALRFTPPAGGMAVWAQAPGIDAARWAQAALQRDVLFQPGVRFSFSGTGARDRLRLGFAACAADKLVEAVRRMAAVMPRR